MNEYKGLNEDQVALLVGYLNRNIEKLRKRAEDYESSNNPVLSIMANTEHAKANELDCALAYLLGLMHGE